MIGDATLFLERTILKAGWRVVQPVIDFWSEHPPKDFPNYAAGSQGPVTADELLGHDGRSWLPIK